MSERRITGSEQIVMERVRQVLGEGYTADHDRGHSRELMAAAGCYVLVAEIGPDGWHDSEGNYVPPGGWPWAEEYWKPSEDPVRNLVKAGALIAAAIDSIEEDS